MSHTPAHLGSVTPREGGCESYPGTLGVSAGAKKEERGEGEKEEEREGKTGGRARGEGEGVGEGSVAGLNMPVSAARV